MNPNNEIQNIVALACRVLFKAGCMEGIGGHVSIRDPIGDSYWINPLRKGLDEVTASEVVKVNLEGRVIEGNERPSNGAQFHPEIYKVRPDVSVIVHTHTTSGAILATRRQYPRMVHLYSTFFQHSCAIADDPIDGLHKSLQANKHLLVPYHGVISVGQDVGLTVAEHFILDRAAAFDIEAGPNVGEMTADEVSRIQAAEQEADFLQTTWEWLVRQI